MTTARTFIEGVLPFVNTEERTAICALARSARFIYPEGKRPRSAILRNPSPELLAVERTAAALEQRGLVQFGRAYSDGCRRLSLTAMGEDIARKFTDEDD